MSDVKEFVIKVEYSCGAETPEGAVDQFCQWLNEGRRTISVYEIGSPDVFVGEIEMGWVG